MRLITPLMLAFAVAAATSVATAQTSTTEPTKKDTPAEATKPADATKPATPAEATKPATPSPTPAPKAATKKEVPELGTTTRVRRVASKRRARSSRRLVGGYRPVWVYRAHEKKRHYKLVWRKFGGYFAPGKVRVGAYVLPRRSWCACRGAHAYHGWHH
jgi:hypothetical protein